jgi:alpha-glucosidase
MLATYLMTLSGTPFLLAGQEIGTANLGNDYGADAYIDVEGKNYYDEVLKARGGDVSKMGDVMRELQLKSRDHGRLPMQWSAAPNAGFTSADATPWMTINKDHKKWNVESQLDDANSVLSFWKQLLALRKQYTDLLVYGSYTPLPESETGEMVLGYERMSYEDGQKAVVLLSFNKHEETVSVERYRKYSVLVENNCSDVVDGKITIKPYGSVVLLG